jgi:hypothetical protein
MKKKSSILAALATAAMAASASASLLIYEPFDYTAGQQIDGQVDTYAANPADTWQVAGSSPLHIVGSGSLNPSADMLTAGFPTSIGNMADLKKNSTSSAYDRLSIPNAYNPDLTPKYASGSALYYSLLLDVPSITGLTIAHSNANANNDGLIAFSNTQGSQAGAPNSWSGELAIRLGSVAGTYNLGIRGSTTTANTTYWTDDLTPGDTHFIVVEAQINAADTDGTNSMWLDPASGFGDNSNIPAASGSSNGDGSTSGTWGMVSIIIGAGIATKGAAPNDTYMDEIRVGDTWADVTAAPVVPEPAGLSLLGFGALGAMARRRRRA